MSPLITGRIGFRNDPEPAQRRTWFDWFRRNRTAVGPAVESSQFQPVLRSDHTWNTP